MQTKYQPAKIPASAGIVINEIHKEMECIFNDTCYDTVLHAARLLFGPRCVKHTDREIIIKDHINLTLSLSWNETKIYFYSYILEPGQEITDRLRKNNNVFRLFGLDNFINYLIIKRDENEYISQHEG